MATYSTQAIVLSSRNFGEADRILTLLTFERGKVRAVARGARRPRNRLAALVQPLSHIEALIMEGNQLDTLSQGQLLNSFRFLGEDLDKMSHALYLNELFEMAIEGATEVRDYFILLLTGYELLQNLDNLQIIRAFIEVKLNILQGFAPVLSKCSICGKGSEQVQEQLWNYYPDEGAIKCKGCSQGAYFVELTQPALLLWRTLSREDSRWLVNQNVSGKVLAELRPALNASLSLALGKLPKSSSFLNSLYQLD
ncbi:MAG: DNA repair protein RecO [Firmicutes bacterium]|nr:DNA repair protein RecO [Bacillota bacterium]